MKFLAYLICYLIYPFSFLLPRSRRKYVFGSYRGSFADNAKYLFIYSVENGTVTYKYGAPLFIKEDNYIFNLEGYELYTNQDDKNNVITDKVPLIGNIVTISNALSASQSVYVEDGSYIRIKNIALGYTLPNRLVQKAKIENVRVYFNVQNLYTFTNYSGYDPEVGAYNQNVLLRGVDYARYPSQRIYTFGINLNF